MKTETSSTDSDIIIVDCDASNFVPISATPEELERRQKQRDAFLVRIRGRNTQNPRPENPTPNG